MKQNKTDRSGTMFHILLKAGLWGHLSERVDTIPALTADEWMKVIGLARKQTVIGLIYDGIDYLPEEVRPDQSVMRKLFTIILGNENLHKQLNHSLAEIVSRLADAGIPSMLLKGQGNAQLYNKPLTRQCGDIDLFVGIKNYKKVCLLVKEWGMLTDGEESESIKHFHFEWNKTVVEIHRITAQFDNFIINKRFREWSESELANTTYGFIPSNEKVKVAVGSPEFNAIFIFYHLYYHFLTGGVGLRQFCDWTRCLHVNADVLRSSDIAKRIKGLHLLRPWQVMGYIAVNYLGLPSSEFPCYDTRYEKTAHRVLSIIFDEGNFGQYKQPKEKRPKDYVLGKFYSFRHGSIRYFKMLTVFPVDALVRFVFSFIEGIIHLFLDYRKSK